MRTIFTFALALTLAACGALVDANSSCYGQQATNHGGDCVAPSLSIPAFPPPPCWNEAGEIQSDAVCGLLDDRSKASGTADGKLPGPPPLPM